MPNENYDIMVKLNRMEKDLKEIKLVLDLVDAEANRLVWRGVATDTVAGSPDAQTRQIETATRQMFRRYPPAR